MAKKPSDAEQVEAYLQALEHPMKAEIEALRTIIKTAHPKIRERIKWNAPSYYSTADIVTFGPPMRKLDEVLLVFHHPAAVKIESGILEGNYKDRRLAVFRSMAEVEGGSLELGRILRVIIEAMDREG